MCSNMNKNMFLNIFTGTNISERYLNGVYSYIISNWPDPLNFYKDFDERMEAEYRKEVLLYFSVLGIYRGISVPKYITQKIDSKKAIKILKVLLKDFNKLEKIIEEKKRIGIDKSYIESLYYLVYKACCYYGKNQYKDIRVDMILDIEFLESFNKEQAVRYRLLDLMYHMGYSDIKAKDIIWNNKRKVKEAEDGNYGDNLKIILQEYKVVISNHMGVRQVNQKLSDLNMFLLWIKEKFSLRIVENLDLVTRKEWLLYIRYIGDIEVYSNKTKNSKLLTVVQFFEWIKILYPLIINKNLILERNDYNKITNYKNNLNSLAFKNANDARQILSFLIYEYKPEDIYEEFYVAAIIISANSGMRRSEISDIEYGDVRFDEDTKLYVIEHNVVDKLSVKNRPIYITELAYKQIIKIMDIRKNNDILTKRRPRKGGEPYVHLFEFKSSDILYSPKFDDFMIKINKTLGIKKEKDEVDAGLHGYRHYFATEVFKESGYDISTVKYLLRHKSYSMTLNYLSQEREKEIIRLREGLEEDIKFEGMGVEKIVNALFFENSDILLDKKIINASKNLSELIKQKEIKKLSIGYCLNPCDNANKCFKCNNFLVEKAERGKLLEFAIEQSELIKLKVYILKKSLSESDVKNKVKSDIEDLMIIIRELEGLGSTEDEINSILIGENL